MNSIDLAIVIVNWNTSELLRVCLASVFANTGPSFEVCVVDNASNDGSAEMVSAVFPRVHLIRTISNAGFSRASNAGLRSFGFGTFGGGAGPAARYALLLNPDTAVPSDAFSRMLQFLDSRPDVGVAGPRLVRQDGTLDPACRRAFPTPALSFYHFSGLSKLFPKSRRFGRYNLSFCDPNEFTEVDSVNGAFMIVRGSAVEKVGLLDEEFFFGGEDLDWAYRIKAANWKVYYYPEVCVRHVKRAAFRKNPEASYEFKRAMWIFYRKHYRATTPRLLDWVIRAGLALLGGMRLVREMRHASPPAASKEA